MRGPAGLLAVLLSVLFLVYGGLNLVERNMAELTGHRYSHEAFSIRSDPQGLLVITFGGRTASFDAGALCAMLKQWWNRLYDRSQAIFHGKNP